MKAVAKRAAKCLAIALAVLLAVGIAAPFLSVNRFAPRIKATLEAALKRKVELGPVHFSLFTGPGFSVENVVIHENPAFGVEPIAYVASLQAVPRLLSLFGGRLELASIRLDDASINVAKSGGPAETGRWNFEPLLNATVIRAIPELHVRSGRINFKFGDTKSVFYLTNTDLDITPPARVASGWSVDFTGQPARTDKPARGFGIFQARGRWTPAASDALDLDVRLERSAISEIVALVQGYDAGVHGTVSAHIRVAGPLDGLRVGGRVDLEDIHRWDLMPPYGQSWPFRVAGRLNLPAQTIEVEYTTAGQQAPPLSIRFRCASYLSQPRWGVALNWNRFPITPLLDLARHMGAAPPPQLKMTGSVDGVVGYSGRGSLQGVLDFHDASVAIPDSPPVGAAEARLVFDNGHARLAPTSVRTVLEEQAQVAADYDWAGQKLDLTISTDSMRVESLRAQAALAAVPWLEQVPNGIWSGHLHYQLAALQSGWTGNIELQDATFPLPGIAEPVLLQSGAAQIDGPRLVLDHIRAQAGRISVEGAYRYEPHLPRPHRLHIRVSEADAGELERLFMPSLRPNRGLLARALSLGRPGLPEWLAGRHLDATVRIGALHIGDALLRDVETHLVWDAAKADFQEVQAKLAEGRLTGMMSVALRGNRPAYHLEARVKGCVWKSGKVDADTVTESSGTGAELLARLHSSGTFEAHGVELEALPDLESVAGGYDLVWSQPTPLLRFTGLQLVAGDDTYTGQGATQSDGRLSILLSSGVKEMRMSGTLAELRVDQPDAR